MAPRQGRSVKKVATNELKLRRLQENNHRLQEELDRPRTVVSLASMSLINYCRDTRDPLLPGLWGPVSKGEDPYTPVEQTGCCSVM